MLVLESQFIRHAAFHVNYLLLSGGGPKKRQINRRPKAPKINHSLVNFRSAVANGKRDFGFSLFETRDVIHVVIFV